MSFFLEKTSYFSLIIQRIFLHPFCDFDVILKCTFESVDFLFDQRMTEDLFLWIVQQRFEQTAHRFSQLVFYVEQSIYDQSVFLSKSRIFCSETLFQIRVLLVLDVYKRDSSAARNRKSCSFEDLVRNVKMWLTLVLVASLQSFRHHEFLHRKLVIEHLSNLFESLGDRGRCILFE